MNAPRSESELVSILKNGEPASRTKAALELAMTGTEVSVPQLKEAMETADQLLRLACGFALWRIARDKDGLNAIVESLSSGSPDARDGAVYVLGALGKPVIPCLEEILKAKPDRQEIKRILDEIRAAAGNNP